MIIVKPVLLMQAIATAYFYDTHWDKMTQRLASGVAGEVALLIDDIEGTNVTRRQIVRSEEHTSELQSLMRISYAVFCLKKKKQQSKIKTYTQDSIHKVYITTQHNMVVSE